MKRILGIALCAALLVALPAVAGASGGISNWSAPSTWSASGGLATGGRTALAVSATPLPFIPVTPCRVADTRGNGFTGAYGPPSIGTGAARTFALPGRCGIPASAVAVSFNFAVWNTTSYGDFNIFPAGSAPAAVSTLNWGPGVLALANAAVIPLGTSGGITVLNESPGTVDLFFDVNGYYASTQPTATTFAINSPGLYAIRGESTAAGTGVGVGGWAVGATTGYGGYFVGSAYGAYGIGAGGGTGIVGTSTSGTGVNGSSSSGNGVVGTSGGATAISGTTTGPAGSFGVYGKSTNSNGMWAESTNWDGLLASGGRDGAYIVGARHGALGASTGVTGILFGVSGSSASTTPGAAGVFGQEASGAPSGWDLQGIGGVTGVSADRNAVLGVTRIGSGTGVKAVRLDTASPFGMATQAELAWSSSTAGRFFGNVSISAAPFSAGNLSVAGTLSKGAGSFKIDHPLDPENKYLYHSFVESPDMMNVYNGMIELDADGSAVVKLPAYFQALNREFRYQLTAVGSRQPGIYVDQEVANNEFVIAGGKPYGKVSWQVTGIRKDPFANANRIIPEVEKEAEARGHYLHPDAYGKTGQKSADVVVQETQIRKEAEKAQEK